MRLNSLQFRDSYSVEFKLWRFQINRTKEDGSCDATGSRVGWGGTSAGRILLLRVVKMISILICKCLLSANWAQPLQHRGKRKSDLGHYWWRPCCSMALLPMMSRGLRLVCIGFWFWSKQCSGCGILHCGVCCLCSKEEADGDQGKFGFQSILDS